MKLPSKGFSLIEIAIGLAILGILMAAGVPSLRNWIQSSQIRTEAESIHNGLELARSEAVRRNMVVRFQLTTSIDNGCAISGAGTNWVVSLSDPSAACSLSAANSNNVGTIQAHSSQEGSANTVVVSTASTVFFNGLGRQALAGGPPSIVIFNVTNPLGGACAVAGGPMRCLDVTVSLAGKVRMCDPAIAAPDPQGCAAP